MSHFSKFDRAISGDYPDIEGVAGAQLHAADREIAQLRQLCGELLDLLLSDDEPSYEMTMERVERARRLLGV